MNKNRVLTALCTVAVMFILLAEVLWIPEKVSSEAIKAARASLETFRLTHPLENPRYLAVVDFTKPSHLERMAVIDLKTGEESFYRVAHGKNSGEEYAVKFSDAFESNMSSLGLFRVLLPYSGDHGEAMRLEGLEPAVNGNALKRDIVLHSADYVSLSYILLNIVTFNGPRIGRSNGCFVVAQSDIRAVMQKLAKGSFMYAWAAEEP
jgi:hypothetical protein